MELIVFTLQPGLDKTNEKIKLDRSVAQATVNKNQKELDVKDDLSKMPCNVMNANLPDIISGPSLSDILPEENKFILDIDMDFFSTQNPFKLLYTEVGRV